MGSIRKALIHFDKFYPHVYSPALWRSIRLGLLCKSKKMFLLNTSYNDADILIRQLKTNGSMNFLDNLVIRDTILSSIYIENELLKKDLIPIGTQLNEFVKSTKYIGERKFYSKSIMDSSTNYSSNYEEEEMSKYLIEDIHKIKSLKIDFEQLNLPSQLKVFAYPRGVIKKDFPVPYDELKQSGMYPIDGFSILTVLLMNLQKGDKVLDMCAAPGGKSLAMLHTGLPSELVCIDKEKSRISRLRNVLKTHTFTDDLRKVTIIHGDSVLETQYMSDYFDKVLVDAPCTADRHAVTTNSFSLFSPQNERKRIELLEVQHNLLRTAIRSCKVGGDVIYSTCTLSPIQNDKVVADIITDINSQETGFQLQLVDCNANYVRRNEKIPMPDTLSSDWFSTYTDRNMLGLVVLPNVLNNYGPGYVCKIRKVPLGKLP